MTYEKLLNVAKLGVPLATVGAMHGFVKKKKKKTKDIIGSGATAIVGASFTKAAYSI